MIAAINPSTKITNAIMTNVMFILNASPNAGKKTKRKNNAAINATINAIIGFSFPIHITNLNVVSD